jgi:CubicO group peptidase (beta-lactamase class C family)
VHVADHDPKCRIFHRLYKTAPNSRLIRDSSLLPFRLPDPRLRPRKYHWSIDERPFDQFLVEPLNLTSTSFHVPQSPVESIVPYNTTTSWWFADLLDLTPAGGYFSFLNDMRKIGKAMLGSTQLDPAVTGRWMKPHSFLSNPDAAPGTPWEIYRAPCNPSIMMMTKAGDLGMYSSYLVLTPQLGIVFTVL